MPSTTDRSLEALKKILLQEDQLKLKRLETEIARLQKQIADKESLIASLDPVIADLLERKIANSKDEMAAALAPIMSDAIKRQIADARDEVVDALYPIIGKIIRKSVAEAMKKLVDTINQKIDQALRRSLFKKRIQSKITGVPEGELLLKEAMPFKIEEVFLIHKESGLLLSHVSSRQAEVKVDEDLIGGMLTAIRNFVSEAFETDKTQDLNEIRYGDSKILVDVGHHSYLAIVMSGVEPDRFKDDILNLSRKIHKRYSKPLRLFDGDITQFGEMTRSLKNFIQKYDRKPEATRPPKAKPYFLYLLLSGLLICLIILGINRIPSYLASRSAQEQIPTVSELRQQEIINEIRQRMAQSDELRNLNANFLFEGDQLIIEGKVPNLKLKRDVSYLVSEFAETRFIINNLAIQDEALSFDAVKQYLDRCTIGFDANNSVIAEKYYGQLDSVLLWLNALERVQLVIKGYSDNLADSVYNLTLSEQRAKSVANYLVAKGLPDTTIRVEFYGEENAIASNETEPGRAQNRRVEFEIIPKKR